MVILGIDPGYERLGWGVITTQGPTVQFVACGLISTPKTKTPFQRLTQLSIELESVLQTYEPTRVALETLFFSKNQTTALLVAQARGTILSTIGRWNSTTDIVEFGPGQIKLAVTGHGGSDKRAVEKMVRLQLKGIPEKLVDDTLDALAVAMTASSTHY